MPPFDFEYYHHCILIFEYITNFISVTTLLMSIISIQIIFSKTSNIAKLYRHLLIGHIIAQQINCIHFLLFKTIYLLPTNAFIVKTVFFVSGPAITLISPIIELYMIVIIADLLLCMFVERYFSTTKGVIYNQKISQELTFVGIFITNFLLIFSYIFALVVGGHLLGAEESKRYMFENFYGLNTKVQNFGVTTVFSSISWYTVPFGLFVILFISSRIFGYLFYTHKIVKCLKMVRSEHNFFSYFYNINAVKTLLIQLFTLLIFGCIPVTVIVIFYVFKTPTFELYIVLQCFYHFYFLIDMFCVVFLIRPYRKALCNCIFRYTKNSDIVES